ncbi:MAG: type I-F CRISPR-associated helicase Cas3f [Candidatus Sericytochromatia bacterium]
MMVTFVSQCEKKALKKTRQILDAFANRIGDKTWQTVITQEGLNAVQRLLRKSASKNTAVACHWLRGHNRTELVWIVGQRKQFSAEGWVPVATTQSKIINIQDEDNWQHLPLIASLTALAALFHDWGKATQCFQDKLKASHQKQRLGDPLRHEWMSCLLLQAFVHNGSEQAADHEWLTRLGQGELNETELRQALDRNSQAKPLAQLPPAAQMIAWLVLSHHRLPVQQEHKEMNRWKGEAFLCPSDLLGAITAEFGYQNKFDEETYQKRLASCFEFPYGLLSESEPWLKQLKKWATKLQNQLGELEQAYQKGTWRLILHYSRLALMLGDHFYSSQDKDPQWQGLQSLFANTQKSDANKRELKQKLDEHLVHVAKNALHIAWLLPAFETKLETLKDVRRLKKMSPPAFAWQDKAVKAIKNWRTESPVSTESHRAFFAVNMASTGCGKTFANAKIMRALSPDGNSLRYILALGLRTLTLQTGDEYRSRVGLNDSEMAVLIGSKAVLELHEMQQRVPQQEISDEALLGSESLENLLDGEIRFSGAIPQERLSTLFASSKQNTKSKEISLKNQQFLYAPVLVCTIDHLMAATETTRGGKYILPCLRLMSSDLVIDEIDDFTDTDLIAIGRLIHLAGMLGRKVMISSATIPPDLAEGYLNAYQSGWRLFSQARGLNPQIACAWIDEFKTQVTTLKDTPDLLEEYREAHQRFVTKRVERLADPEKTPIRRKGLIIDCEQIKTEATKETQEHRYFEKIRETALELHCQHHSIDPTTQKRVSFGVIRVANIEPCIALAKYLLQAEWEQGVQPKIMAYHSRQVLLLRSVQEKHLETVLKRNEAPGEPPQAFQDPLIREHLNTSAAEDILFLLVATPVEEIGRDHDFDWAVVEPSSYRSVIQLAGRVRRHRPWAISSANVALMQYNLKALKGQSIAYLHPGYEQPPSCAQGKLQLYTHDLKVLLSGCDVEKSIQAIPRIQKALALDPHHRLADLEHAALAFLLTSYQDEGPESLQGWLSQDWWLTALPQRFSPFRKKTDSLQLYRVWDGEDFYFMERDANGEYQKRQEHYQIEIETPATTSGYASRLWLERDYATLLTEVGDKQHLSLSAASKRYGEINLSFYGNLHTTKRSAFFYSDQFGMERLKS